VWSQFSTHNECSSGRTCRTQLGLSAVLLRVKSHSECIPAYVYRSDLLIDRKTMSISYSNVHHAVYMQNLLLAVRLSPQFFLFTSERSHRRVLLYCTSSPLFAFARERIFLFILSISDYPDTSLNRHYWRNKVVRINEVWLYYKYLSTLAMFLCYWSWHKMHCMPIV